MFDIRVYDIAIFPGWYAHCGGETTKRTATYAGFAYAGFGFHEASPFKTC